MIEKRENDLVLASNEYAFIQDSTTGAIDVIVGPYKKSLAGTDQPMKHDPNTNRFIRTNIDKAIQVFPDVNERSYVVLHSPSADAGNPHPKSGTTNPAADLMIGKKINIQGPKSFPLWPGQKADVIEGHQLRSNQYLVVQIYNEEEAQKTIVDGKSTPFTTGQLLIIKGTEDEFFIPSTGFEVLKDETGSFVRNAVTLERLEYCILLDESGDKRYVRGPDVVFPKPTETFVRKNNNVKFNAIELTPHMGIYIKVIADYDDVEAGTELFITGKDQKIYFPITEHAIVKYDNKMVHYAIAIPKGEARYVLNRDNGEITTITGPEMFLPDPRTQVIVRRALSNNKCELWFPGNEDAKNHNANLRVETVAGEDFVRERSYAKKRGFESSALYSHTLGAETKSMRAGAADFGDDFKRKTKFTPPRSITLDTKFDGAVVINVWPGYAVQVVNKTGERNVIVGPAAVVLDYDQTLEVMELSTDNPKSDDVLLKTVYLRVNNNRISDEVEFVTKDLVDVTVQINFNVNFEGDTTKWFAIENYVKYLTQHLRSIIRNVMKTYGIDDVNQNAVNIIRDAILGKSKSGNRKGRSYEDNGMKVYDVQVLDVQINDGEISNLLQSEQRDVVRTSLRLTKKHRLLTTTQKEEEINRLIAEEQAATEIAQLELDRTLATARLESDKEDVANVNTLALQRITNKSEQVNANKAIEISTNETNKTIERFNHEATLALQDMLDKINTSTSNREKESLEIKLAAIQKEHEIGTTAYTQKIGAIQPKLVEAVIAAGKSELLSEYIENMPAANGEIGHLFGLGGWNGLQKSITGTGLETALDFNDNGVETAVEEG